jgi:hypothetical protein
MATATTRMSSAPTTTDVAARMSTSRRIRRSRRRTTKPPDSSRSVSPLDTRTAGVAASTSIGSRTSRTDATAMTVAKATKTSPGWDRASSRPPTSGPTKTPRFSARPDTAFAAVRSCGVWVIAGRIAACVGRVIVRAMAAMVAQAIVTGKGAASSIASPVVPSVTTCAR